MWWWVGLNGGVSAGWIDGPRRRCSRAAAPPHVAVGASAEWGARQYQLTNRLSHLAFLRTRGVRAWLVHLLFTNDPSHEPDKQTSEIEWCKAMSNAYQALGIPDNRPP